MSEALFRESYIKRSDRIYHGEIYIGRIFREKDRKFICLAANNHDALVDAVKEVRLMLNTEFVNYKSEPWAKRIIEVLVKIEKEQGNG